MPAGPKSTNTPPRRPRLATLWLGGCSGCHMSFLDLDERLLELFAAAELVYSPLVDVKVFPEDVDVVLIEGAVANRDNVELLLQARERSRVLVAFGDCAVTGNVTAMRNPLGGALPVLEASYLGGNNTQAQLPQEWPNPELLDRVVPIHELVNVDCWLPGCPPSADLIHYAVLELIAGRQPDLRGRLRYG